MQYVESLLENRRCFAEISLSALRHNIHEVYKKLDEDIPICAVIKANAYGHGAIKIAHTCVEEGIKHFAVSCLSEAIELRESGIAEEIIILGPSAPESIKILIDNNFTQTVNSYEEAHSFSETMTVFNDQGVEINHPLRIHFKIDTGMSRHGFATNSKQAFEQSKNDLVRAAKLPGLDIEGMYTHFATASTEGDKFLNKQESIFQMMVAALEEEGIQIPVKHAANTSALVRDRKYHHDMVRVGIALFGGHDGELMREACKLEPVMTLKAKISAIRDLEKGDTVSYGRLFTAEEPMRIGVIECGYADGVLRALSGKALFSVHGKIAPQIGAICMDRCMIDLSHIPEAKIGEYIIIFGGHGDDFIDAEKQAQRASTISYELFCLVGNRVPRIYFDE